MWKTRFIANGRCYHLISRLAHQAFFLDDDEKTRAVELLRRAEDYEWCSLAAAVRGRGDEKARLCLNVRQR